VASNAPFTGIHNAYLDKLINQGATTLNNAKRGKIYRQIFEYMSQHALPDFIDTGDGYSIATTNAHGLGIDTNQIDPYWQDAWVSH
jgi:ABC-type transport system substrate-binding protein